LRGTNRIAGGGDETGDLKRSAPETHGVRPSAAIPGIARERVNFLFSTAIPDALKKKKALRKAPEGFFDSGR